MAFFLEQQQQKQTYTTHMSYVVDIYSIYKNFSLNTLKEKHFCGISSGNHSKTSNVVIFLMENTAFFFHWWQKKIMRKIAFVKGISSLTQCF